MAARLIEAWSRAGPWARYVVLASVVLSVGIALPGVDDPGEGSSSDLGFDLVGLTERWNGLLLDPELLLDPDPRSLDGARAQTRISVPEIDLDWTIDAELHPGTGNVRRLRLYLPLWQSDEASIASERGMLTVIAVVEGFSEIGRAQPLLHELLDLVEASPEFYAESQTEAGRYALTFSVDGIELEAGA